MAEPTVEAWRSVATTIVLGRSDDLIPPRLREWAAAHFADVRFTDSNHLIPFRRPDVIAEIVAEAVHAT